MPAPASAALVTLTPAPAWDLTYSLERLELGEVHRARSVSKEFAGKGVNVSKNLSLGGVNAPAIVPLSRADQESVADADGVVPVDIAGALRSNITVVEPSGRTTKINQQPPALDDGQWESLVEATRARVNPDGSTWIVLSGTIPGSPDTIAQRSSWLADTLGHAGRLAVDTSGAALAVCARSGLVEVIKPNVAELAECVGRPLDTLGDVLAAATEVIGWGVGTVLVSLGEDGFVGVRDGEVVWARSEQVAVTNTIGAGDASIAGYFWSTLHHPDDLSQAVCTAAMWGAQKVQHPGSQLDTLAGLPQVSVSDIDRAHTVSSL